jgi:hypothetical protein
VEELDYPDLIKLVFHKFLMKHFDLGKERKRSTSVLPGPQKLFPIWTIPSIAPGFSQGVKENDHKGL